MQFSPYFHAMDSGHVYFEFLSCAFEGTRWTLASPHMSHHVSLQPLLGNGTIRTLLARVWLLSSVSPHVIPQVSGKVSCVVTVSTFVDLEGSACPAWCHASPPVPALVGTVQQHLLSMSNLFICFTLVYLQLAHLMPTQVYS